MNFKKTIHQTWKTTQIPEELRFCTESWKRLNPDWEYILWTDALMDIFVREHYPEIYSHYTAYSHNIFRADLFRLLVVYHGGGVYVDLDMECLKSLDYLFETFINGSDAEVVLSYEPPYHSKGTVNMPLLYHVTFLAGKPGSIILDKIIKACLANGTEHPSSQVIFVTGPVAITRCLKGLLPDKRVLVLDYKIVNPFLDISNEKISRFDKRHSFRMLLTKKYPSQTCMAHYWHHAYWDVKPLLAWSRPELEREYRKSKSLIYTLKDLLYKLLMRVFYATRNFKRKIRHSQHNRDCDKNYMKNIYD